MNTAPHDSGTTTMAPRATKTTNVTVLATIAPILAACFPNEQISQPMPSTIITAIVMGYGCVTMSSSCQFRLATPADAEQILDIYAPFCDRTAVSFELQAPSLSEMQQRIQQITAQLPWIVCEGPRIIGYVYASPHRKYAAYSWNVESSIYVHPSYHRFGIGRALYTTLFRLLKLQGYFRVYAGITVPNPSSISLHQSLGFQPIGIYRNTGYKLGRWLDVEWWERSLQPEGTEPRPPQPITELAESLVVQEILQAGVSLLKPLPVH